MATKRKQLPERNTRPPIERMLKFELSGTLNQPKLELKHIPKGLLVPFQLPFKVLDELVPDAEPDGRGP